MPRLPTMRVIGSQDISMTFAADMFSYQQIRNPKVEIRNKFKSIQTVKSETNQAPPAAGCKLAEQRRHFRLLALEGRRLTFVLIFVETPQANCLEVPRY